MNENDIMSAEEQIKLPKNIDDNNNSYQFHYNYNSPNYQKDLNPNIYEFNYNDDLKQFDTSPKMCLHHHITKKFNTIIPHHHHLPRHIHHTPQCRSHSSSPSPIKNISQPLYFRTYYNSNLNGPYDNNLINTDDKIGNSQIFFSDELSNDFSNNNNNNNALQKFNENNDIDDNNININNTNGDNHLKAMDFDDYMSKMVYNKYNKMKQFNESYYLRKQFGDETNYTNINNTFNDESINNEFNTMRKNLEKKYKLYNLITKYDNLNLNNDNIDENINKNKEDEEEEIDDKRNKEKKNKKQLKKNKKKKHGKKISSSSSDNEEYFDSSPEKNNFVKDEKNNRNIIQKTFNENIGQKNSSYVSSTFNHVKDKDNANNNESNISNSNLLEYLKKENEDLKNLNNNYKQTLDTLFYFLNNIFNKYRKGEEEGENQYNDLFELSKDINNTKDLSKKLINLETLINDNDKNNNKFKTNSLLIMTKENSLKLPESTKLEKFNDLIEGINEKCFSFKNDDDNFIERYKNDKSDNNKIKNNNIIKINQEINKEKEFINKVNNQNDNDKDKCVACLLGCNVSKRGYSPMRYNPNNKKEERKDDSGDLFDEYKEKKEKSKSKNKRNINKISKSKDNSIDNSSGNNRKNKSMTRQKKVWK